MTTLPNLKRIISLDDLSERLFTHPLYQKIHDDDTLRHFMRAHVFCVWDFQSLLKALQAKVTCVSVPWFPTGDNQARRFINEIVLDEESDALPEGGYASHYELYLSAMHSCGADTLPIASFIQDLQRGTPIYTALERQNLPAGVSHFVRHTMTVIATGKTHRIAAAFTYGREDVIPDMFQSLVQQLAGRAPENWSPFLYYLERHIEADGDKHGPLAHALMSQLCGDNPTLWQQAQETARASLEARIALWDAIAEEIN